jgi:hypothetical protein
MKGDKTMEEEIKKEVEYTWRLTWSSYTDTPMFRASIKRLNIFPLWKDSEAKIVTYEEYKQMIADGLIQAPQDYWIIKAGKVGVVSKTCYKKYTAVWDQINIAYHDFCDGWIACEKLQHEKEQQIQKEVDHVQAIKMNREFNKYGEIPAHIKFRCNYCNRNITLTLRRSESKAVCSNCKETDFLEFIKEIV